MPNNETPAPAPDLTTEEIQLAVDLAKQSAGLALLIPVEKAKALRRQVALEDDLLPLLDPTRWMRDRETLEANTEFIRAFVDFRLRLDAIKTSLMGEPS